MDFHTLIDCGVLNSCNYAEVVQVILLRKKDNVCLNILHMCCFHQVFQRKKVVCF